MKAVQVLSVEDNGRYVLCEDALRQAAAGVANLPVAVLSVAGATRGGKSFLLDFLLRYLYAPEEGRCNGSWLGAEDEPLTGFGWRGGCDRHTEGILMWPEPIVVNVGTDDHKREVAVILLDTQGSFDSTSTVRDSSTVFAISTLLASVQVYNLSQNIKEDDLQYLQLFTEYGKLARDEQETRPFQELMFLVRDWAWAYQHPHGGKGGQELLDKRLEIRAEQAEELREVRAHIRGVFERVRAFLLAHPGLPAATHPAFTGCLKELTPEFKQGLLELVPSLLSAENLSVKRVNGQTVTMQDFVDYFRRYVDIFNSDTLPTPTTVMEATSAASIEAAIRASRSVYTAHIQRCARGAACVPRSALPIHHAAALEAARTAFLSRRTFAAPDVSSLRLEAFIQELEALLSDRISINTAYILEAAASCKLAYVSAMTTDSCLASTDLLDKHQAAIDVAKTAFYDAFRPLVDIDNDSTRERQRDDDSEGEEDIQIDWDVVKQDLQELLPLHREQNEARIEAAMTRAREAYISNMDKGVSEYACLHPRSLRSLHRASVAAARDLFARAWLQHIAPQEQEQRLRTFTEEQYPEYVAKNDANNEAEILESVSVYRDIMTSIYDDDEGHCLHPRDLQTHHSRAEEAAVARFKGQRDPASGDAPCDQHQRNLIRGLIPVYQELGSLNELRNKAAVRTSHEYYMSHIAPLRLGGEGVLEFFGPPDLDVFSRHAPVKQDAIERFLARRRPGGSTEDDPFMKDLEKKIEDSYSWIVAKVLFNLTAQGLSVFAMTSTLLTGMRR